MLIKAKPITIKERYLKVSLPEPEKPELCRLLPDKIYKHGKFIAIRKNIN